MTELRPIEPLPAQYPSLDLFLNIYSAGNKLINLEVL